MRIGWTSNSKLTGNSRPTGGAPSARAGSSAATRENPNAQQQLGNIPGNLAANQAFGGQSIADAMQAMQLQGGLRNLNALGTFGGNLGLNQDITSDLSNFFASGGAASPDVEDGCNHDSSPSQWEAEAKLRETGVVDERVEQMNKRGK